MQPPKKINGCPISVKKLAGELAACETSIGKSNRKLDQVDGGNCASKKASLESRLDICKQMKAEIMKNKTTKSSTKVTKSKSAKSNKNNGECFKTYSMLRKRYFKL